MKNHIEVNPDICHGKPVIRGTRIMVRNILGALAGGDSIQDILQNYPELTHADIDTVIAYQLSTQAKEKASIVVDLHKIRYQKKVSATSDLNSNLL